MRYRRMGMAIIVIAFLLRFYGVGDACYWMDEFDSLECSSGRGLAHAGLATNRWMSGMPELIRLRGAPGWEKIWGSLDLDNHPPLYFILLRWWREGFGDSEAATRMLSVIFSTAAVGIFYALVREQMAGEGAIWATGLMAVASSQIYFAQQTRGYAMWDFLAMLGVLAVVRLGRRGSGAGWMAVLFLNVLALPLTHYFAMATVASLGILAAFWLRGRRRVECMGCIVGGCAGYAAVWGKFLWRQRLAVGVNNQWQADQGSHHVWMTLERAGILPVRWLSEAVANHLSMAAGAWVAGAVGVIFLGMLWGLRGRREAWFWGIFLGPLVIGVAGVDLAHDSRLLSVARYTFVAGPGVFALLGFCTQGRWRVGGRVLCAAAMGLSIATLPSVYVKDQDWRMVAQALRVGVKPGDRIVYYSGGREAWWAGAMYMGIDFYAPGLPGETILLTEDRAGALKPALQRGHSTWVLCARIGEGAGELFPGAVVVDSVVAPNVGRVSRLTK